MVTAKTCCCCMTLRTGTYMAAVFSLVRHLCWPNLDSVSDNWILGLAMIVIPFSAGMLETCVPEYCVRKCMLCGNQGCRTQERVDFGHQYVYYASSGNAGFQRTRSSVAFLWILQVMRQFDKMDELRVIGSFCCESTEQQFVWWGKSRENKNVIIVQDFPVF